MYKKGEIDIRSRENVSKNGEVFTPIKIVDEMLELLPKEVWPDKTYCFLEPTCGNGQFLERLLLKRIDNGLSMEEALNTMIGMDITDINIKDSRKRLYKIAKYNTTDKEVLERVKVILVNNIFKVNDSLEVLSDYGKKTGVLFNKKFAYNDPTGNNNVMSLEEIAG